MTLTLMSMGYGELVDALLYDNAQKEGRRNKGQPVDSYLSCPTTKPN